MTAERTPEPKTVTLSDGSVWTYNPEHVLLPWWRHGQSAHYEQRWSAMPYAIRGESKQGDTAHSRLTASDHRAIADVLDPPSDACESGAAPCNEPSCAMRAEWCRYHALRVPTDGIAGGQTAALPLREPPAGPSTFERRLDAIELANTVQRWCEGTFREDVPFSEVTAMFRAKIAALREPERPAEPDAWIVQAADGYSSIPMTQKRDVDETVAAWTNGPHMAQPITVVPLYRRPTPSVPSEGAASPERQP